MIKLKHIHPIKADYISLPVAKAVRTVQPHMVCASDKEYREFHSEQLRIVRERLNCTCNQQTP